MAAAALPGLQLPLQWQSTALPCKAMLTATSGLFPGAAFVWRQLDIRRQTCANAAFRKQPDTFRLTLAIRKSLSDRLFENGVSAGLGKRRTFLLWAARRSRRLWTSDLSTSPRCPFICGGIPGISASSR